MDVLKAIIDNIVGQWELFVRLAFACICGAIIGIERSHKRKDAGIKTHIILAMGAALFMIVSAYGFRGLNLTEAFSADVSRIASNIVTGVSFLCAGVIFVRHGSVKGLTTATGIWATAGIGMAAGAGMYAITLFATLLIILIRIILNGVSMRLESHGTLELTLAVKKDENINEKVNAITEYAKTPPSDIKVSRLEETDMLSVKMTIHVQRRINELELIDRIKADSIITEISWTN